METPTGIYPFKQCVITLKMYLLHIITSLTAKFFQALRYQALKTC